MANEKRLIKADPIYNGILIYMASNAYLNDTALDVLKMVATWIEEAPTVDAVEVVRCKDCKHYMTIHCTCDGCCISDDWYCADGERRTDERKID